MAQIRADEITRVLRDEIENYDSAVSVTETGFVISVGDGIARIHGLETVMAGELIEFDLPLELHGSEFNRRCWLALSSIPYGQTVSYGEQARRLGLGSEAARAVGAANGRNPLPIVLPCHRVIGADGSLTGFGGGLHVKRFLLELEGALLPLG